MPKTVKQLQKELREARKDLNRFRGQRYTLQNFIEEIHTHATESAIANKQMNDRWVLLHSARIMREVDWL